MKRKVLSILMVMILVFGSLSFAAAGVTSTATTALVESTLDDASITLELTEETFADDTLVTGSFTLNNAPTGLTVESVTYLSTTTCKVDLAFDGTEMSADVADFSITIAALELAGVGDLTTQDMTISMGMIDGSLVTELVAMITQILGLFSVFPLNVMVIGGLGVIAFTWFKKAKRAAS